MVRHGYQKKKHENKNKKKKKKEKKKKEGTKGRGIHAFQGKAALHIDNRQKLFGMKKR